MSVTELAHDAVNNVVRRSGVVTIVPHFHGRAAGRCGTLRCARRPVPQDPSVVVKLYDIPGNCSGTEGIQRIALALFFSVVPAAKGRLSFGDCRRDLGRNLRPAHGSHHRRRGGRSRWGWCSGITIPRSLDSSTKPGGPNGRCEQTLHHRVGDTVCPLLSGVARPVDCQRTLRTCTSRLLLHNMRQFMRQQFLTPAHPRRISPGSEYDISP